MAQPISDHIQKEENRNGKKLYWRCESSAFGFILDDLHDGGIAKETSLAIEKVSGDAPIARAV